MRSGATVPQWPDDRFIEFLMGAVFVFIKETFPFSRLVNSATATSERGKEAVGRSALSRFRPWFLYSLPKSRQLGNPNDKGAIFGTPGGRALPFRIYLEMLVLEMFRDAPGLFHLDLFGRGV